MRLLLLPFFFFNVFVCMAQDGQREVYSDKKPSDITAKAAVLYSNDFGIPGEWTVQNTSSNNADWQITTNQSISPIPFFNPAGFSSASNGYAFIDSDAQGTNESQDCIISLNTLISDCATKPFVLLRFQQMLRRFNDTTSVEVSNDGTNWTEFLVNTNLQNNDNTPNPQQVDINISTVAGNQDTVYIRFRYRASDAWFWAVDDVQILEQDEYDLEGLETDFGSTGNWGLRMPYYQIPVSQIAPVSITGRIKNKGHEAQTDIIITSSDGQGYSSSSLTEALNGNQTATLDIQSNWTPPSSLGTKTVNTIVSSAEMEGDTTNDELESFTIEISPKYYARSTDVRTGRVSNNFHQFGYETGNIFDMYSDATVTSAMVHVANESTPGSLLYARLYEAIDSVTFNLLSISDTIIIPTLTNDEVYRVRLITPTLLEAGKSYLLTAGSDGSATFPGLVMGTSNEAEIFTTFFKAANSITWFSFLETPMIKMNFESVTNIATRYTEKFTLDVFPNPSTGQFTLEVNNQDEKELSMELRTATGALVYQINGTLKENKITFEYLDLPNGTYFLTVNSSSSSVTKKIVVLK